MKQTIKEIEVLAQEMERRASQPINDWLKEENKCTEEYPLGDNLEPYDIKGNR